MDPQSSGELITFVVALYFIPSIIAFVRDAKNKAAIIVLNILTGWTLLGWLIALIWSLAAEKRNAMRQLRSVPNHSCPTCGAKLV
jgi:hypothetical protein